MADENISDELARLWRLRAGARLGRPAGLDVDRVVRTAIDLADLGGLPAVTLPKIAAALGVTPMSLYRHIGSKDELNVLMADLALGPFPDIPGVVPGDWRPALSHWARAQLAVHRRHPWLAQLPIVGPPRGPHAIAWMDVGLRTLRETALDWPAKIGVITVVGGYVRQAFLTGRQLEVHRGAADLNESQALRGYQRELSAVVDETRFPDVAALLASGLFESIPDTAEPGDEDFDFGLDLILDGVAGVIAG
ncbi:TetR/AcrR family transcriptional regulator [Nocardia jejuensis]|uniref:TetR/AcrR family transcriptional regulator n=1 Tax=Nocardia jejuensis TaxID=328049 RepID=UPI00082CABCC|nr:TetR/AcrR family transcriptional regulator [Nocardia jejuensis]